MSRNDRMILLAVPVLAAVAAFWFLVLSPKQDQAKKLGSQVSALQEEVSTQQQAAAEGRDARRHFPRAYHRLVVMGKAVPADDETASLVIEVNRIAKRSGVSFRKIDLNEGAGGSSGSAAAAPAPATSSSDNSSSGGENSSGSSGSTSAPATATPAAPTESSASLLPIGATVGSAQLPILPYSMTFRGSYFAVAEFMAGIDALVKADKGRIEADGRLATIDGFTMGQVQNAPPGVLDATLAITTYVTPPDQGLTAGATPTGPAAAAAPASVAAPSSTSAPTSAPATP